MSGELLTGTQVMTRGRARAVTAALALASSRTAESAGPPSPPIVEQPADGGGVGADEVLAGVYLSNIQSISQTTNSFDADFICLAAAA